MKNRRWLIPGLLILNAVLAAGLICRIGGWRAHAARARAILRGSHYLTVSGSSSAGGAVYVLDVDTGVLGGWIISPTNPRRLVFIAPESISQDIRRLQRRLR